MDTETPGLPRVGPAAFRHVLGHVPTAVTVVTTSTARGPAGMVIGSFVSISLEPPLVGIFIDEHSGCGAALMHAGGFTVNILAEDQRDLCARFARRGDDKFEGLAWSRSPLGHPLLSGTIGWVDCAVRDVHKLGDHFLAVGEVTGLALEDVSAPLISYRGALCTASGQPAAVP